MGPEEYATIEMLKEELQGVLGIKLYTVMIIDSKDYKKSLKALSYTKVEGTSAPRGRIYDRNHKIIVDNTAIKSLSLIHILIQCCD